MNEAVVIKNRLRISGGNKPLVRPFRRQELCKFVGCILLAVTYKNKILKIWIEIPKTLGKKLPSKLQSDVRGNTTLNKVYCNLCRPYYCYTCH